MSGQGEPGSERIRILEAGHGQHTMKKTVHGNLKADFQRIAITHHEEIAKLLAKQREYVEQIATEALTVAEPVLPAAEKNILHIL